MDLSNVWAPKEGGERLAQQDSLARGKAALEAYETLGNLAMQPAKQELLTQQAALAKSRAEQEAMENDAARRLQGEMQKGGDLPKDPTQALYEIAQRASRAGATREATTALQRAGQSIQQQAAAVRALTQAETAQTQDKIRKNGTFANALGGVTNQVTLDAANRMYEETFQEPSPMRGKAYNPAEVRAWQDSTLTANQRLTAKLHEIDERGRNWGRSIIDRHNRATEALREREIERREEQDANREKNGGKGVGKPSTGDLAAADNILKLNQPDLKDVLGRKLASESIASRANQLMREVRGLSRDEALQRAYDEELEEGSFESDNRRIPGIDVAIPGTKKTTFTGGGKSAESPLPVPAGDNPTKSMKKGRYYKTGKGSLKWNGKDFDAPEAQ